MADIVFNISKGRAVEYYNRVESSDPANAAFILVPIETAGLETDAVLRDKDDLAAVLSGATNEQTTMGRTEQRRRRRTEKFLGGAASILLAILLRRKD